MFRRSYFEEAGSAASRKLKEFVGRSWMRKERKTEKEKKEGKKIEKERKEERKKERKKEANKQRRD